MEYLCDVINNRKTYSSCHRFASKELLATVANLLVGHIFWFLQTTDLCVLSVRNVLFGAFCPKNMKIGHGVVQTRVS